LEKNQNSKEKASPSRGKTSQPSSSITRERKLHKKGCRGDVKNPPQSRKRGEKKKVPSFAQKREPMREDTPGFRSTRQFGETPLPEVLYQPAPFTPEKNPKKRPPIHQGPSECSGKQGGHLDHGRPMSSPTPKRSSGEGGDTRARRVPLKKSPLRKK